MFYTEAIVTQELTSLQKLIQNLPLQTLLTALIVLVVGIIAVRLLLKLSDKLLKKTSLDGSLHRFIRSVLRIVLYLLVILLTAGTLGINITSLVALLSVVSLALSLAVQGVLSNMAGGAMIMGTKPFKQGDLIETEGILGTVKDIGMVYTTVITVNNQKVFIPNSKISSAIIQNYSALGKRRLDLQFTAAYNSAPATVLEALQEAIDIPQVLPEPPIIQIADYNASDIAYAVCVWVAPEDYLTAKYAITQRVWDCFRSRGIEMTYPHVNVHLNQEE